MHEFAIKLGEEPKMNYMFFVSDNGLGYFLVTESQYMGILQSYHEKAFKDMEKLTSDTHIWISDKPIKLHPCPLKVMERVNKTRAILETIVRLTTTKPFTDVKSNHSFYDFLDEQVTGIASIIDDVETVALCYHAEQKKN